MNYFHHHQEDNPPLLEDHRVENISSDDPEEVYDVVGPVCESSDVFVKEMSIDKCHRGDFMAIRSAGAYGEAMASRYNLHALPEAYYDWRR